MAKQYKVTVELPSDIKATQRIRAGVVVSREYGYTGPLTDEQLEAIKADNYLTVKEVGKSAGDEGDGDEKTEKPLSKMNRTELEEVATNEGIEDTSQYENKKALVAAIEAKRAESAGDEGDE